MPFSSIYGIDTCSTLFFLRLFTPFGHCVKLVEQSSERVDRDRLASSQLWISLRIKNSAAHWDRHRGRNGLRLLTLFCVGGCPSTAEVTRIRPHLRTRIARKA